MSAAPFFSFVIPSRNRPSQAERAVRSIIEQNFFHLEIFLVLDGPGSVEALRYKMLESEFAPTLSIIELPRRPRGHGPSYVRNTGAFAARGQYLAFLDDDDFYTDSRYLARLFDYLSENSEVDVSIFNQVGVRSDGNPIDNVIWMEDLPDRMSYRKNLCAGIASVSVEDLINSYNFPHVNTLVVKRDSFITIGGFNESLRYEEDRDFYFKLLDAQYSFVYCADIVAQHNIPDTAKKVNESTSIPLLLQSLRRANICEEHLLLATDARLEKYYKQQLCWSEKRIASIFHDSGKASLGFQYAMRALTLNFSWKWLLFTGKLLFMCLIKP